MKRSGPSVGIFLAILMILPVSCGCPVNVDKEEETDAAAAPVAELPPLDRHEESESEVKEPIPIDLPPEEEPTEIPQVEMIASDLATCVVKVGDTMPGGELVDVRGNSVAIQSLFGTRATVLFFWRGDSRMSSMTAKAALKALQHEVVDAYGAHGVHVVVVYLGDDGAAARELASDVGATYPVLLDPEESYFQHVATDLLPRIYVLDAQGKIAWFDGEYSEATRRNLLQTLGVIMSK